MDSQTSEVLHTTRIKADGTPYHVVLTPAGLTIGMRPGRGRLVSWSEIIMLADAPPVVKHGVVVNSLLCHVFTAEADAHDKAAEHRQLGEDAIVIRVPAHYAG